MPAKRGAPGETSPYARTKPSGVARMRAQHALGRGRLTREYPRAPCATGPTRSSPSTRRPASSAPPCSRTGSRSARCARGRGRASARWRRSRSSSPRTARTRSTGCGRRRRREAALRRAARPPTRWPPCARSAIVDAAGDVAAHTGEELHPVRRPRDRRALGLPGEHDGRATRSRPRCAAAFEAADGRPRRAADGRARRPPRARAATCAGASRRRWSSCRAEGEPWRRADRPARRGPRRPARRAAPPAAASSARTSWPGEADELLAAGRADEAGALYRRAAELAPELATSCCSGPAWRSPHAGDLDDRASTPCAGRSSSHPGWLTLLDRLSPDFAPAGEAVRRALGVERQISR